jgi:peptidoglycan/LPS O-acetylase OafA/YrhL
MLNNSKSLHFLDGLRGMAAVYVMIGHARWLLWEGYGSYSEHPELYSFLEKLNMYFFAFFKYGHQMVMFFFILSGFVIHLKNAQVLKMNSNAEINWMSYYFKRIIRIVPPFFTVLLIGYFIDEIGLLNHFEIYHSKTNYDLINNNIHANHGLINLLGNVFFLGGITYPVWGTNGPLWSLSLEWWFYVIYPLFIIIGRKKIWLPSMIVVFFFFLSQTISSEILIIFQRIFSAFICWWFGVVLADIYTGRIKFPIRHLDLLILSFMPLYWVINSTISDILVSLGFVGIVTILLHLKNENIFIRLLTKLKPLGTISYSLYICHFPILVLLSGWLMSLNNGLLPSNQIYIWIGALLSIALSILVYYISEKPSLYLKTLLK